MEFKVSSGKSQGVAKLREIFPGSWSKEPASRVPKMVLVDSLQGLIGFENGTGRDCAMRVSRLPRQYVDASCPLVILCFDVQEDVPIAKSAEQSLRAAATRRARMAKDALAPEPGRGFRELPSPGIWADEVVPHDFAEGLQDREGYRREVIRFLSKQWLCSADPRAQLRPSPGCRVVISGHCLNPADLVELTESDSDWRALGLRAGDDPERVPLVLENDAFRFAPELGHRLGEAEMQFFHFLDRLRPESALVISTDSDVLFLAMIHLRRVARSGDAVELDWRYDGRQPERRYCHVNGFVEDVRRGAMHLPALKRKLRKNSDFAHVARRWADQEDPAMQIVAAQALAGTDYTQGMLRVTHEAVFEALIIGCDKIGPLVLDVGARRVSSEAYLRLLVASWIQARLPALPLAPAAAHDDPIAARSAWIKHHLRAWADSQRFESRYRFPHPTEDAPHYCNRILRWAYYMNMVLQVGRAALALDDPTLWGYGPTDEPVTRANVRPLLGE